MKWFDKLLKSIENPKITKPFGENTFSVIFTNLFALVFAIALLYLCKEFGADRLNHMYNLLVVLAGALFGWALGMFFSPFNEKEGARFSTISQTLSVFCVRVCRE